MSAPVSPPPPPSPVKGEGAKTEFSPIKGEGVKTEFSPVKGEGEKHTPMARRFRGFLPVVVDVETGGFNPRTDALLEIAAVILGMDPDGNLHPRDTYSFHVKPFAGAKIEEAALKVNGIDPWHPLRPALEEKDALGRIFKAVREAMQEYGCTRAVLVGHNASFDHSFLYAAAERAGLKRNPFHPFSTFDTVTLAGVACGQTVLRRAVEAFGLPWDDEAAHSARYDTERTAELFCLIVNRFRPLFEQALPVPEETAAEIAPESLP
jgi:ribonuclease T